MALNPRARTLHAVSAGFVLLAGGTARAQDYSFPTSAADYGAFYPTAYVDHGGVTDWNCGDLTYSGHRGSDYGGGSWTGMDEGRDIVAAATGVVVDAHDGEYDRCSSGDCAGGGGYGNYVKLSHGDGKATIYAHLKQWSVLVGTGQTVSCGQKMGEMGSSGYSTGPHVHFEVREASGTSSDPFDGPCSAPPDYWVDPGPYGGLPGLVCEDTGPCAVAGRLRCGEAIGSANNAGGSTGNHAAYGCSEYVYSGPEIAYEFATELGEGVTLRLTGLSADLDLNLLGSEACDGTGCVGASVNADAADEAVSFTATAGQRYVVVIDGWEGAVSNFTLSAECSGGWPGEGGDDDTTPPPDDDTTPPVSDDDTVPGVDDDTAPGTDDDTPPAGGGPDEPPDTVERFGGCGSGCDSGMAGDGAGELASTGAAAALALGRRRRRRSG